MPAEFDRSAACDRLIAELDSIARDYEHYEYGLPVGNDEVGERMRTAVLAELAAAERAAREECATYLREYAGRRHGVVTIANEIRTLADSLLAASPAARTGGT